MIQELTNQDLMEINGGTISDWFQTIGGAFGVGATIGMAVAGPPGALAGGVAGAAVGNALYALAAYYDRR